MKLRGIIAGAMAFAFSVSLAFAQTGQGSSPLTIAKGGTNATTASAARSSLGLAIGSATQAWDADLDALAANSTSGFWARTGSGTGAARTLTAPAAGFTITNPAGTAGNPTFVLANDLAAVEGLSCTGVAIRSATDTWLCRTIGGTANEITVSNGDGVSGAPTISLPSALTFTGKTVTGGTFSGSAFTGTADVQQALALTGDISPTQLSANTNDWAPTGFSTASAIRLSTDASRNITGLAGGADGRIIILHNVGSFDAVLKNQDAGSTAANRFLFGGDVTLLADYSVTLRYDSTTSRWRAITTASSGAGGGTVTSAQIAAGGGISVSGTCTITTSGTCTVAQRAPTVQVLTSGTGATYTTAAGVSYIRVRGCGGGGGGAGSGTGVSGGNGGDGGTTSFSASTMSATGGGGGNATSGTGIAGGAGTNGQINYTGAGGQGLLTGVAGNFLSRIPGAASPLFGGGGAGTPPTNSGSGGASGQFSGAGSTGGAGAAGGCFERIIPSPSATYTYTIGAGGSAGAAGTSGGVGLAGAAGVIVVEEF